MNQEHIQLKANHLVHDIQETAPVTYEEAVKLALLTSKRVLAENPSCNYWFTYSDETPSAVTVWSEIRDYLESKLLEIEIKEESN